MKTTMTVAQPYGYDDRPINESFQRLAYYRSTATVEIEGKIYTCEIKQSRAEYEPQSESDRDTWIRTRLAIQILALLRNELFDKLGYSTGIPGSGR